MFIFLYKHALVSSVMTLIRVEHSLFFTCTQKKKKKTGESLSISLGSLGKRERHLVGKPLTFQILLVSP